jgi:hypothetical protein
MTGETIRLVEEELKAAYPEASATTDGNRRLIKLPEVHYPLGCRPATGTVLVVLDPSAPKPEVYLSEAPVLPSGSRVSIGNVTIAGQSWQTFSFNAAWEEERHTAIQFLEGKLARFRRGS